MRVLVRVLPTLMCVVVGSTSFLLSYVALRDVSAATHAVPATLAWAVPVCVDGGILAASGAIWAASYQRRRRDPLAFVTVAVLLATSVWINIHHAGATPLAKWIAALPPITLLACLEMVAAQHRREVDDEPDTTTAPQATPHAADPVGVAAAPSTPVPAPPVSAAAPVEAPAAGPVEARAAVPAAADVPAPASAPAPVTRVDPAPALEAAAAATRAPARAAVAAEAPSPARPAVAAAPGRPGPGRRELRVQAAAPAEQASVADLVREAFDRHVEAGGDPDDSGLAAKLAEELDATAQYVRRILRPLREDRLRTSA